MTHLVVPEWDSYLSIYRGCSHMLILDWYNLACCIIDVTVSLNFFCQVVSWINFIIWCLGPIHSFLFLFSILIPVGTSNTQVLQTFSNLCFLFSGLYCNSSFGLGWSSWRLLCTVCKCWWFGLCYKVSCLLCLGKLGYVWKSLTKWVSFSGLNNSQWSIWNIWPLCWAENPLKPYHLSSDFLHGFQLVMKWIKISSAGVTEQILI